jgi:hypothetical protein
MAQILRAPSSQRQPFCDLSALVCRGLFGSGPHFRSARRAAIGHPAGDVAATPPNATPDPDGLGSPTDGHMAVPTPFRNARDLCRSSRVQEFGVRRRVTAIPSHGYSFVHGSGKGTARYHTGFLDSSGRFPAWPIRKIFGVVRRCGAHVVVASHKPNEYKGLRRCDRGAKNVRLRLAPGECRVIQRKSPLFVGANPACWSTRSSSSVAAAKVRSCGCGSAASATTGESSSADRPSAFGPHAARWQKQ